MTTIYSLVNPTNGLVFYIGATRRRIKQRYREHIHPSMYGIRRTFKENIITELLSNGVYPEVLILDEVENESASFFEDFYVDLMRSWGFYLPQMRSNYKGEMLRLLSSDYKSIRVKKLP